MALGRRKAKRRQDALWTATDAVAKGPGHPLYARLNGTFAESDFDAACARRPPGPSWPLGLRRKQRSIQPNGVRKEIA